MSHHPLDNSEPHRRLLKMAAKAIAKRLFYRTETLDEGHFEDEVLAITIGMDVKADGRAHWVAHQWFADHTGHLLNHGVIEP